MKNQKIPVKYGIITGILLIVYFLLLAAIGLHTNPIFSLLNGVITGAGIYYSIKQLRKHKKKKFKYQKGFMAGLLTGFFATVIFTLFFGIYASNIDPNFSQKLITSWETEYKTGLGTLLFVVAVMGFATTFVLTLSFMQLFKDSWNPSHKENPSFSSKHTEIKEG